MYLVRRGNKYGATTNEYNGRTYHSKKEAAFAQQLLYKCNNCGLYFEPKHHGLNEPKFCSHRCSNLFHIPIRKKKEKIAEYKNCKYCGNIYKRNNYFSNNQWENSKFCSRICSGQSKKIIDQYKDKQERYARKHGLLKQGTQEFKELISERTKEGMKNPKVQALIHKKRSPLTKVHRNKISDRLVGKMPKNIMGTQGKYGNVKRGWYLVNGKEMYFRSKWEVNYAKYLDFLKEKGEIKDWSYETSVFIFHKIKFGTRSYRPDFTVINKNGETEYHEIKGYMDSKSATKLKRMAKYYPHEKLILIDGESYKNIKEWGKMLNFI